MYCKEMISIGKASNGYVIEACVPLKETKKKGDIGVCCRPELEAKFVAATVDECVAKIKELLPKLDADYSSEKEFEAAFGAAVSEDEEED
jgi:hypothetical protein